jgi:hypothetical protein
MTWVKQRMACGQWKGLLEGISETADEALDKDDRGDCRTMSCNKSVFRWFYIIVCTFLQFLNKGETAVRWRSIVCLVWLNSERIEQFALALNRARASSSNFLDKETTQ